MDNLSVTLVDGWHPGRPDLLDLLLHYDRNRLAPEVAQRVTSHIVMIPTALPGSHK